MEWALFRPLRENPLGGLIASIGFLLILQSLAVLGFGLRMQNVPPVSKERLILGGAVLTYERLRSSWSRSCCWGCSGCSCEDPLRLGAAGRRAGPRGGRAAGHLDRPDGPLAMFIGAALAGVAGALTAPLVAPTP